MNCKALRLLRATVVLPGLAAILLASSSAWAQVSTTLNKIEQTGLITLGYRVGAPNRFTPEAKQYLRWFPSAEQQWPCVFTIQPYQDPRVPAPGLYIVAYFTPEGTLHHDRYFKMLIPFFEPRVKWSRGDRKLVLDPPAVRL